MNNEQLREIEKKMGDEGIFILSSAASSQMADFALDLFNFANLNPDKTIQLYISAMRDDFITSMTIYDIIKTIKNPISAIAMGKLPIYSTLIVAACTKGKRFALKHATLEVSQPKGYLVPGTNLETDVTISAKESKNEREEYERLLALETGLPLEEIHRLTQEGTTLHAEEAVKLNIIDKVL